MAALRWSAPSAQIALRHEHLGGARAVQEKRSRDILPTMTDIKANLRPVSGPELAILAKLLRAHADVLPYMPQLAGIQVRTIDEYNSLELRPAQAVTDPNPGPMRKLVVEGAHTDSDGVRVSLLLFQRSGWLCELQIYKVDDTSVKSPVTAASLRVDVLGCESPPS